MNRRKIQIKNWFIPQNHRYFWTQFYNGTILMIHLKFYYIYYLSIQCFGCHLDLNVKNRFRFNLPFTVCVRARVCARAPDLCAVSLPGWIRLARRRTRTRTRCVNGTEPVRRAGSEPHVMRNVCPPKLVWIYQIGIPEFQRLLGFKGF